MLEMSGLEYQAIRIDFSQEQQRSDAFLALNPLGRVPALEVPEGVITEALAILNYIDARAQCEGLSSPFFQAKTPYLAAQVDAFNAFMASTVHVTHAHLWRAGRWVESAQAKSEMAEKVPLNMAEHFRLIENHWYQGPWLHGQQFTSSDLYLFTVASWLKGDGVEISQFEKIQAHFLKMQQLNSVDLIVSNYHC